jgi:hypothetical protein
MTRLTPSEPGQRDWSVFFDRADKFLEKTAQYVHLGVNPGDYYTSIWTRDAAYILRDQFLTGDTYNVLQCLYFIWASQIDLNNQKIVYGRGSPELNFKIQHADARTKEKFRGALPSTIYQHEGISEVYGRNPDIDSTALMVSTTSWILDTYLKSGLYSYYDDLKSAPKPLSSADYRKQRSNLSNSVRQSSSSSTTFTLNQISMPLSRVILKPTELIKFIVPRMDVAIHYLASRDIDNDGLLEQGYNEDWMDTALRAGKIVYDQASWILAARDFSSLLSEIGEENMASSLTRMAERTINAVEKKLWSEEDGAYIDIKYDGVEGRNNQERMLTQDVSLYLVAITENSNNDNLSMRFKGVNNNGDNRNDGCQNIRRYFDKKSTRRATDKTIEDRAARTLETIKNRIWKDGARPVITEKELKRTGPWILDSNQYHNHTFWPWITGIEMLARSRFQRYGECNELLSELTRENYSQTLAYYEWVNPVTGIGSGAFPFRTGISTIRMALTDTLLSHYS